MLFNSHLFLLCFLPAAILCYALAGAAPRARIFVLLLFSLVFYAWWEPRFLPLLLGSIAINWLAARIYVATQNSAVITAAIILDLSLLGLFKYNGFFAENLAALTGSAARPLGFALPLGISFFTFHHVMYLADLRRGRAQLTTIDRYALYICFFPQAIAGPLARWSEVGAQFGRRLSHPGWERRVALATAFFTLGLVEKVMLGDPIGRLLDPLYAEARNGLISDGGAWLALGFVFQIFFDFAGYSNMAMGLGLLFGVELPVNFDAPFRARSILEFWQRWHMTLGRFLRDYVFLRLADLRIAGRRHTTAQYVAAMLATMALCGLWHGAGWTFILWGTLQGVAMVAALAWRRRFGLLPGIIGWALTLAFSMATAILFRAGSLDAALNVYASLATLPSPALLSQAWIIGLAILVAVAAPPARTLCPRLIQLPTPAAPFALGAIGLAILIQLGGLESYDFIYFNF